mgnify:CR=1 FL=1
MILRNTYIHTNVKQALIKLFYLSSNNVNLDICAASCRNISKAKNKEGGEGGCNQYTTPKHIISEDTG